MSDHNLTVSFSFRRAGLGVICTATSGDKQINLMMRDQQEHFIESRYPGLSKNLLIKDAMHELLKSMEL